MMKNVRCVRYERAAPFARMDEEWLKTKAHMTQIVQLYLPCNLGVCVVCGSFPPPPSHALFAMQRASLLISVAFLAIASNALSCTTDADCPPPSTCSTSCPTRRRQLARNSSKEDLMLTKRAKGSSVWRDKMVSLFEKKPKARDYYCSGKPRGGTSQRVRSEGLCESEQGRRLFGVPSTCTGTCTGPPPPVPPPPSPPPAPRKSVTGFDKTELSLTKK